MRKTTTHRAAGLPYHEQAQGIAARSLSINRGLCKHLDAAILPALVVWQLSTIALFPHSLKKLAWWVFRPKSAQRHHVISSSELLSETTGVRRMARNPHYNKRGGLVGSRPAPTRFSPDRKTPPPRVA
ncbi:MAG TPA: hypothetical protein VFW87_23790 [Pirellulales bacterium]|nr:hypothetical protein [Pirellulales bacterium]